jgi:hypothetical protein
MWAQSMSKGAARKGLSGQREFARRVLALLTSPRLALGRVRLRKGRVQGVLFKPRAATGDG